MWCNVQTWLIRHRFLLTLAVVLCVMMLRPALAMADDECDDDGHNFFGCGGSSGFGVVAIILAIIQIILQIVGLVKANNPTL